MKTDERLALWRVQWVHRNGYQAPSQLVEAKNYKEAHTMVMNSKARLLDFPESWHFELINLNKNQINGKWY